jgi:hypothetical protein
MLMTEYVVGPGFKQRIDELNLTPLGPEVYFVEGYSFVLTDKGSLFYSRYTNTVVGPLQRHAGAAPPILQAARPAYIVKRSPNDSGAMGAIYGIVVHATRSGTMNNPNEGIGTVNYCCRAGTTSYNYIIDRDGSVYELVPPGRAAWHAAELNYNWLGVALAQGHVDDPITDQQHETLAWLLRMLCQQYEIPLKRLATLAGPKADRGIVEHKDTAQGRGYGKSDVGAQLDWRKLGIG